MDIYPGQFVWWEGQRAQVVSVTGVIVIIKMPDGSTTSITKASVVLA